MNSLVKNIELAVKEAFEEFAELVSDKYNLDMNELVELWNQTCNSIQLTTTKKDSIVKKSTIPSSKTIITPIPSSNTSDSGGCKHIMIRGERKGQNCGVKTSKDNSYCARHKKPEEKTPTKVVKESIISKKVTKDDVPSGTIIARRNKDLDAYWHQETGFVFKSATDQQVVGKCVDGNLISLTEEDKELCETMNLTYTETEIKSPVKSNLSKVTVAKKTESKVTSAKNVSSKVVKSEIKLEHPECFTPIGWEAGREEDDEEEKSMSVIKKITSIPPELVKTAKDIKKSIHKITTSEEDEDKKKTVLQKNTNAKTSTSKKTEAKVTKNFEESVEDFINKLQESGPDDIEEEEELLEEDE